MKAHSLVLPGGGRLRLGVVSDTHGRPHPDTVRLLAAERPNAILHAGDIGDPACLAPFAALAPLFAVRGNIDVRDAKHPESAILSIASNGTTGLRLLLLHRAVHGPRLQTEVHRHALGVEADLVVCGHSHTPLVASDRGVAVFNPGSCGPKRVGLPITFGVIDVTAGGVRFRHVDCTTGADWRPEAR